MSDLQILKQEIRLTREYSRLVHSDFFALHLIPIETLGMLGEDYSLCWSCIYRR